ncbi:hypothetical protein J437_LFUL006379 [Ladona fulva]|uniref:Uncharacterized protein n=1 Tax=Ladona fulva TaxID=123851 RepID=A0A8K0NY67_LADFU|nr:hypothetical protein J437_LFUL006379 [Ladona fulva]
MFRIKIAILGPSRSGKTCISNFLANEVEQFGGEYRQTKGVRVLEFESPYVNIDGKNINSEIEMWDCSGGMKFKQFWPVFLYKADGYIFVYDSSNVNEVKELELFLEYFIDKQDIEWINCMIFDNKKGKTKKNGRKLPEKYSQIKQVTVNAEDDLKKMKDQFKDFLSSILGRMWDMKDQDDYMLPK